MGDVLWITIQVKYTAKSAGGQEKKRPYGARRGFRGNILQIRNISAAAGHARNLTKRGAAYIMDRPVLMDKGRKSVVTYGGHLTVGTPGNFEGGR